MAIKQNITDRDSDPALVGTTYTVRSPHPGFGVDPNIRNEYGHTNYPKWVDHPTEIEGKTKDGTPIPKRVMVADEKEEKALGKGPPEMKAKAVDAKATDAKTADAKATDWNK